MPKYLITFGKYEETIEAENDNEAFLEFYRRHGISSFLALPKSLVNVREEESYDKKDNL